MRCLVVDDFATMRRVLRSQLRGLGCIAVDEAADGRSALKALRRERYDLVISDVGMPGMSGHELLAAMRRDRLLVGVPMLLVTAEARREDIVRAQRDGAATIVKPFDRATLEARLRRCAPAAFDALQAAANSVSPAEHFG